MHKIRLVNKERFQNFLATIGLAIVIGLAVQNPTKGTIQQWQDAVEEGMSWNEYMEEVR